jgi:pyruvate-formate lyase-activating enzyme
MSPGSTLGAGIRLSSLRELWVHTGTACNLSCPFCHEGSQPGDLRIEAPGLDELRPHLDAAAAAGVRRFAFTGGEPLILKGIVPILRHALGLARCLVLTNGTAPLIRRPHHLAQLQGLAHAATFHVSIDDPDETLHDAGRGFRNFRKALQGLKLLSEAGFAVGITCQQRPGVDAAANDARFRALLRKQQLPMDLPIVALPELGPLQTLVTGTADLPRPQAATGPAPPLCSRGRMLLRRAGRLCYTACPLVDDDAGFDLGPRLEDAGAATVLPRHRRCTICLGSGVAYGGDGGSVRT